MTKPDIPEEWLQRNPLITEAGWATLDRALQHQHAPKWNFATGDRLVPGDLALVEEFRTLAATDRAEEINRVATPPAEMLAEITEHRKRSWWFESNLPPRGDLVADWEHLPLMTREDLAARIELVMPHDVADFSRFIVYDTSGTTGHAVRLPHHPILLAKNHALAERAMAAYGVSADFDPSMVCCANICAQRSTYVFANPFSVWNDATFVKVNLSANDWSGGRESARAYLGDLDPQIVTSDPVSLSEAMRWDLPLRPRIIFSTALQLTETLRERVAEFFDCPVVDWYSTTETGPIGFSSPDGDGFRLVAPDLFIEIVDEEGRPVPDGELGEVAVTGGRNPYVYLFRYRTGDHARLRRTPTPTLYDLQGRGVVLFRDSDGNPVSNVDIGRTMRLRSVFVLHEFRQAADGSCRVRIRPAAGVGVDIEGLRRDLARLFGEQPIEIELDDELGLDGKVVPYASELTP